MEIEEKIARIEKKQNKILEILNKMCKTLVLDDEVTRGRKLWELKEEIEKVLSK
jgi:hypothetical protein